MQVPLFIQQSDFVDLTVKFLQFLEENNRFLYEDKHTASACLCEYIIVISCKSLLFLTGVFFF